MGVRMTQPVSDARLMPPDWEPRAGLAWRGRVVRVLVFVNIVLAARYFWWLFSPDRPSHLLLYVLLVGAECFNLVQAIGFWWTCALSWRRRRLAAQPVPAVQAEVPLPNTREPAA